MSRIQKKNSFARNCTNQCMTNHRNYKEKEEIKFRVFQGPNFDKQNLDLQLGFHCNAAVSKFVGTTCSNCWYARKNTFGCSATMTYEDFKAFVENPSAKSHAIYDTCNHEVLARIQKTRRDGVFHMYLIGCMASYEDETKSPYVYILTSKSVEKLVAIATNINLLRSPKNGGKHNGKGADKNRGKGCGRENPGVSLLHTHTTDDDDDGEKKPTKLRLELFIHR